MTNNGKADVVAHDDEVAEPPHCELQQLFVNGPISMAKSSVHTGSTESG